MQGYIWSGGFYNLKRINLKTQEVRFYDGLNSITAIVEKDEKSMQTDIYALTEFSPRKEENIARGYLQGRYGAIPFIGGGI